MKEEAPRSNTANGQIAYRFLVDLDGDGHGTVVEPRLYQLIRQHGPVTEHTFEITSSTRR